MSCGGKIFPFAKGAKSVVIGQLVIDIPCVFYYIICVDILINFGLCASAFEKKP